MKGPHAVSKVMQGGNRVVLSDAKKEGTPPTWNLWRLLDPETWVQPGWMQRHGSFGAYLLALVILYIAYLHRSERRVRQMSLLEQENQELRAQYLYLKTELVQLGKLNRVAPKAARLGLIPMRVPPLAIPLEGGGGTALVGKEGKP
jgi:hypothetical protein